MMVKKKVTKKKKGPVKIKPETIDEAVGRSGSDNNGQDIDIGLRIIGGYTHHTCAHNTI